MRKLTFNMLTSVIYRVAIILTGLAVQRHILAAYGSAVNGLTSAVTQMISYLVLLEAGIGAATVSALHKPLKENDTDKLSSLLSAGGKMYRKAGIAFLVGSLITAALLPIFTAGEASPVTVIALTLLSAAVNLVSYLFVGKYTPLLTADGKIGVIYILDTLSTVLSCGGRILLISLGADILPVQAVMPICAALKALAVWLYVKKSYPLINYKAKPDSELAPRRRSAMVHQIVGLAVSHTDVTILTLFSTLKTVSLYSVYQYIYSSISALLETAFCQATLGSMGKAAAEGKERFNRAFTVLESGYNTILYLILSVALTLTLPFIRLYTAGIQDVEYVNITVAILFCLNGFLSLIRLPSIVAINCYGAFKETERGAVIECIINLSVSLALFPFLGITGLLLGTTAAYLFRTQDTVRFVYRKCELSYLDLLRSNIGNLISAALVIIFGFVLFPVTAESYGEWILKALVLTVSSAVVFLVTNLIFNRKAFLLAKNILTKTQKN